MRHLRPLLAARCWRWALLPAAQAEVWGYVDDKGVAHFAAEKVDERYELFFRGGESFDTAHGLRHAARRGGAHRRRPS